MPVQFDPDIADLPILKCENKELSLTQLIIIHRHAERTPIASTLFPFSPESWKICTLTPTIHSAFIHPSTLSEPSTATDPIPPLHEHLLTTPTLTGEISLGTLNQLNHASPNCFPGQLTDPGKRNMFTLGSNLARSYPFTQSLLPSDIYVRSTDYARTLESVHYLISSFLPKVQVDVNVVKEETMYPSESCGKLNRLVKAFKDIPKTGDSAVMNGHSAYDAAACVRDNLGVHVDGIRSLEDVCVKRWWDMYNVKEIARLASGRFVGQIGDFIKSETPLGIFSGHDSTLAPFLGAFGVFDGRFPPFGSIVAIEVWKEQRSKSAKKYVRMSYNGKRIELEHCKKDGNHLTGDKSACTYNAFMETVSSIVPTDYDSECNSK